MSDPKKAQGLLNLTQTILEQIFNEDKAAKLTDEHMEVLSGIVLHHFIKLESRQRIVLTERFGIGTDAIKTFKVIGDELAVSRECAYQIAQSGLFHLRCAATRDLINTMYDIEFGSKE